MIGWMVQALVATSLLLLLVMALRGPVARAFGPRAAYALWALPALRMILPPLPGWHMLAVPVWHWNAEHKIVGLVVPSTAERLAAEAPLPLIETAPTHVVTIPWPMLLVTLWLGVALVWFGWQMLRYRAFLGRALDSSRRLSRECGIDILISKQVDGPVAAGVLRRRIFLPDDFMTRYAPAERRLALLHEAAHHDRRDLLANLAALAVLALHWWNPLAYRAYRLFRADQELACDATVLADVGKADRHAYGSAVVKSVSARMPGVACALSHKAELKSRLRAMASAPIGKSKLWLGAALAVGLVGTGLLVTASGQAAPQVGSMSSPDIDAIRADAEQARQEGLRAADEAREEARVARDEARQAAQQGREEARIARSEARRLADVERDTARRQVDHGRMAAEQAMTSVAATRHRMAAQCAASGKTVSEDADWTTLALCGDSVDAIVHRSLAAAKVERDSALEQASAARAQANAERTSALAEAARERQLAASQRNSSF
jgi:bla regulator protein BlaR1